MIDAADEAVCMAGGRGPLRLDDVLMYAAKASRIAHVQVVRADRVVGPAHVRSAALHARRAFAEGRNHADRLEVEFTRYLAGERQIQKAIAKMGLPQRADAAVLVGLGTRRQDALKYLLHQLALDEDDALLEADPAKLEAFGITRAAQEATTADRRLDLVLEAVAAVDLMRP